MLSTRQSLAVFVLFTLAVGCSEPASSSKSTNASKIAEKLDTPAVVVEEGSAPVESAKEEVAASTSAPSTWGTLKGRFTYAGQAPQAAKLTITKDQAVCGKHDLFNETLVVNPDNNGIGNVVVWLYQKRGAKEIPVHESYNESATAKVHLDNTSCRFDGHVVALRTSQTLLIRNLDPIGHNTKIDSLSNTAINPILAANTEIEHKFEKPERAPVPVSCSIHPWMNGYVVVQDHPYFAVTNENGEFEIKNLPSGTWTFQAWQEKTKYVTEVTIDGNKRKWKRGRFEQAINGDTDLGDIQVAGAIFD